MSTLLLCFAFLILPLQSSVIKAVDRQVSPSSDLVYSFANTSPLKAIVGLAAENMLPLGIVTRSENNILCSPRDKVEVPARDARSAMAKIAEQSEYHLLDSSNVMLILPNNLSLEEQRILDLDIGNFAPPAASTRILGGFLLASIQGTLHPEEGVAGDILSTPGAPSIQFSMGPHATPERVANKLISGNVPGLWIMSFSKDKSYVFQDLSVYSYVDDISQIARISCYN